MNYILICFDTGGSNHIFPYESLFTPSLRNEFFYFKEKEILKLSGSIYLCTKICTISMWLWKNGNNVMCFTKWSYRYSRRLSYKKHKIQDTAGTWTSEKRIKEAWNSKSITLALKGELGLCIDCLMGNIKRDPSKCTSNHKYSMLYFKK